MRDKAIGFLLLLSSFSVIAFVFVWTILLPVLKGEDFLFKAYIVVAILVFIAILVLMLLTSWVGWSFLKTRAPKELNINKIDITNENKEK
ncbi:MAG: hypothetical protein ACTSSG_02385 [Candidatus Heimdallarchaeaceae archaeon]